MDEPVIEKLLEKKLNIRRFVFLSTTLSIFLSILSVIVFVKIEAVPLIKAGVVLNPKPDLSLGRLFGVWSYCFVYCFNCFICAALINKGLGKINSIWQKVDRWSRNFICFFIAGGLPSFLFGFFLFLSHILIQPHGSLGHDLPSILVNMFMTFLLLIVPIFIPGILAAAIGAIVGPFVGLK